MYAYHYWKCYYKDGVSFQTAKLFSIEVDYYNFGTCEITDGAYFCGDHSCQTFKHIGNLDGKNGMATTVYEHLNRPDGTLVNDVQTQTIEKISDYAVAHASWPATHNVAYSDRYGQPGVPGWNDGTRIQQTSAMYWEHNSLKLDWSILSAGHTRYNRTIVQESPLYVAPIAGDCRKHCDADDRCKIYLENKPTDRRATIDKVRCQLILADRWATEMPEFNNALVSNSGWNTFSKYSNPKPRTWMHAPIHLSNPVVLGHDISTTRGDVTAGIPTGRRLDGVY